MPSSRPPGLPTIKANVRLAGSVDDDMLRAFQSQMDALRDEDPVILELTTLGGDADIGRRLALEVRLLRQQGGREVYFLGKSTCTPRASPSWRRSRRRTGT